MHHLGVAHVNKTTSQGAAYGFDFSEPRQNASSYSAERRNSFAYDEPVRRSLMEEFLKKEAEFIDPPRKVFQAETAAESSPHYASLEAKGSSLKYRGRIFDLFILVEKDERLYIIDQHAAHERILFNRFLEGPIHKQELLAPIPFETDSGGDDAFLESRLEELSALGLVITRGGNHRGCSQWQIEALPVNWKLSDQKTVEEILQLRTSGEDIARRWAATLACHAAIKDGDYLDADAALSLAEEALNLSDPHCPHGRPIWTEISLESLLKAVKRT
jgi:DNA mismatch repair protein MutL